MLNIIHFSTNDFGGAGLAALRVHKECISAGFNSKLYVLNKRSTSSHVYSKSSKIKRIFNAPINRYNNFKKSLFIKNRNSFYSLVGDGNVLNETGLREVITQDINIVVLHWIASFIDVSLIERVCREMDVKIVYYLMDMAMFTGGCHFSHGCEQYKKTCANCPETSNEQYRVKIADNHFKQVRCSIQLAPYAMASSKFLLDQAKDSALQFAGYFMTRPPISKKFEYRPKAQSSVNFKILMGAYKRSDERKGYRDALRALAILDSLLNGVDEKVEVLVPSADFESDFQSFNNIKLKVFSFAKNDEQLIALYNSVDLLFNTSLDDSGPMMVLESQMCGVPFVATEVGVASEIAQMFPDNGEVVALSDADKMAEKIFSAVRLQKSCEQRSVISMNVREYYNLFHSNVENLRKIGALRQ
ncbi:glycosyltransferase [Vibrio harveyi]|uniref:glycosyltransferase n=1 Tax=Vibrio harveyi TaxID=669 RepID=UPI00069FBF17|nr:glycosyltransferase [Vibrio harveyi]EKO3861097.1 glycosyltransferase [Vibrio harveyi]KNY45946.1 hypothetical protein AKG94_10825 [Vibrio harveyi]MCQ9084825.1 glycosyltransferase [Vibrio harveyi]HDM8133122.1 glycosyltransferase [Vibrio harveyi]